MKSFDAIVYINLSIRQDRKASIEKELAKLKVPSHKVHRIEAVHDELNGTRGCVSSHLLALELALARRWANLLILEDDCTIEKPQEAVDRYVEGFFSHFQNDWDVFFLGTDLRDSEPTQHGDYLLVRSSVRAHAYAINGPYISKLRDHYRATLKSMEGDLFFIHSMEKALDRQWSALQRQDRWISLKEPIAFQRSSYSDIEKANKPYR